MICIAVGLGVLGFIAARKARRCGYGHGCHGGWHRHRFHGWHGRRNMWGRGGYGLNMALAHIDATPAQERSIVAEYYQRCFGTELKESGVRAQLV